MTYTDAAPSPVASPSAALGLPGTRGVQTTVFALAYLALAMVSRAVEDPDRSFSTLCLHVGLLFGVLMRTHTRDWPVFAATALPAGMAFEAWVGRPVGLTLMLHASGVCEALLGAWLIRRWVTRTPHVPSARELGAMILIGPGLAIAVGGLLAALGYAAAGASDDITITWLTLWAGDALGTVLVAPIVIVAGVALPYRDLRPRVHPVEPVLVILLAWAWTATVFTRSWSPASSLEYTLVPLAMWAGFRFGIGRAAIANLGIALVAMWVTTNRPGDEATMTSSPLAESAGLLVFLFVTVSSALFASAMALQQLAAAARLASAGDRLRAIFDGARDAIVVADGESGHILDANAATETLTGRSRGELVGHHQFLVHATDGTEARRQWFRSVAAADQSVLTDGRVLAADGRPVPVEVSCSTIRLEDGRGAVIGVFRDVTARLEAEDRSRTILRTSMDAFWLVGVDGRILDVNDMASSMSGYTRQELLTMRVNDLDALESPADTTDRIRRLLAVEHDRFETRHRRKDGTIIDVEVSTTVLPGDQLLCTFLRDITARKLREEQLRYQDNIMQARLRLLEYAPDHSLEEVLTATLDEVEALTGSQVGFYHFVAPDQVTLTLQAWSTRTLKEMCTAEGKGLHYSVGEAGVWVDCVHERRPVIHNDYSALPHRKGLPEGHAPIVREVVVPVVRNGSIVAVLGVGNKTEPYTDQDTDVVTRLADLAWDVVAHKRTQNQLSRREAELRAIYDHAPVMLCVLDEDRQVRYVNRAFEQFTGVPRDITRARRACGVLGCIHAWDDPQGCGFGPTCTTCAIRLALTRTMATGDSVSGVEHRTTLLLDDGPKDVVLTGSTARLSLDDRPLLLLCLVDVSAERQAEEALRTSRNELRALSQRLVAVREEASRRIARELHDRVGQNLTALNINFTRIRERLSVDPADRTIASPLDDSFRLLADTMDHVRDVMAELRPPVLEDYGVAAALRWYGGQVARRAALKVAVDGEFDRRPPRVVETALFRIAQEAVSNAARHASATIVRATIRQTGDGVRLEIADDGTGFNASAPPPTGRWGLLTMRERAAAVGGRLSVSSIPGTGTTIVVDVSWVPDQPLTDVSDGA